MESLSNEAQALGIIRQLYPFLLVICFVGLVIFDFALRLPPKEGAVLPKWRFLVQSLVVLTIFTYVGEAAAYVVRSLVQRGWWAGQTKVIFVLSSILVWGIMSLILVDSTTPRWLPYTGTWATALALEITVFVLSDTVETEKSAFHVIERAVAISRILMVFALSMLGIKIEWTCKRKLSSADEENQPLLGADANGTAETQRDCKNYGTTETTEETETEEQKLRQRVLEQGGWWGYTKQFFIFLPLIWPARNRKMQFYLFIITLCILAERAFNLLIPRQIGIITNKLTEDRGTHHVPWKEISIWIGLRVLKSRAGVDGVMVLVQCLLTQFAYSRLTVAAFRHVMGLSMDFHNDKSSGELLKSVEQGHSLTSLVEYLFVDTAPLLIDLVVVFVYLANLFDGYLAFTVVVVAVTYIWTAIKLTTLNRTGRRRWVDKYVKENKILYESVSNWQTVAYFNRAVHEESRLSVAIDEHIDAYVRYIFFYNIVFAVEGLIMLLGLLVVSFLAAYRISEGTATVGSFVMLMSYWATLSSPLSRLASCYNKLSSDLIDAERMLELFQTKSSVPEQLDAPDLHVNEARVEFQNVSYAYDERKSAIKDISFAAEPGQTIALVGETGSGKSTTLKLLMRFYDVSSGSIQIDGQDIRHVKLDSLRESMGVVPQDPSMFNLSIMENIRYARLDATDEEIYDACRAAAVHDKIMTFPDKYRSKVGERGVKLSGGELQRIAIARVLIKSPQIVLLDEATSAVDSETEVQIQEAFQRLSRGRTTFVVAHRLSTVMDADLILVMNEGSIIERGTHQELLAHGGKYLMLWTKQ
ncbi:putative ABC transporter, partial [Phyllosticta paracitricarpa]